MKQKDFLNALLDNFIVTSLLSYYIMIQEKKASVEESKKKKYNKKKRDLNFYGFEFILMHIYSESFDRKKMF